MSEPQEPPREQAASWEKAVFSSVAMTWCSELSSPTVADCSVFPDNTGRFLWREAALALVQLLCARPQICRGRDVLELAAGCGVPACAAAAVGARLTIATDAADETLPLASANIEANMRLRAAVEEAANRSADEDAAAAADESRRAAHNSAAACAAAAASVEAAKRGDAKSAAGDAERIDEVGDPSDPLRNPWIWGVRASQLASSGSVVSGQLLVRSRSISAASTAPSSPTVRASSAAPQPPELAIGPAPQLTLSQRLVSPPPPPLLLLQQQQQGITALAPGEPPQFPHAARLAWGCERDIAGLAARFGGPRFDVILATDALWLRPYNEDTIFKQALDLLAAAMRLARPVPADGCGGMKGDEEWTWGACCPLIFISSERRQAGVGGDVRRAAHALGLASCVLDARGVKDRRSFVGCGAAGAGGEESSALSYGAPAGATGGESAAAGAGAGYWLERTDGFFVGSGGGGRVCLAAVSPCAACLARALANTDLRALSAADEEAADERACPLENGLERWRPTAAPSEAVSKSGLSVAQRNPLWQRSLVKSPAVR